MHTTHTLTPALHQYTPYKTSVQLQKLALDPSAPAYSVNKVVHQELLRHIAEITVHYVVIHTIVFTRVEIFHAQTISIVLHAMLLI